MMGRRLEDCQFGDFPVPYDDLRPGDYWKYLNRKTGEVMTAQEYNGGADVSGNLTGTVWGYCSPDGGGLGTLVMHTVREHEDGTISVLPGDGSSNSILHKNGYGEQWHGYIRNGDWQPC